VIEAHIDACVVEEDEFTELARWWLAESRLRLFADICHRASTSAEWVMAGISREGIAGMASDRRSTRWSESRFDDLLNSFGVRGTRAAWNVSDLSLEPSVGDCLSANSELQMLEDSSEWISVRLSASYRAAADGSVPWAVQERLIQFVSEFAEAANASFGNITDDNSAGLTSLESRLPRRRRDGILQSGEVLRGYSWVTLCPPAVVSALGGVKALEGSGAFVEVRELAYGGALLRSTERFEEYDESAILRVFRTLAPALPAGSPRQLPDLPGMPKARLIYEDAARYW
jgi:hypothetical protein